LGEFLGIVNAQYRWRKTETGRRVRTLSVSLILLRVQVPSTSHNLAILLAASAIFGLSVGAYDVLFPYYLDHIGVSFESMGIIFSLAALVIAVASVYIASASDSRGRKWSYSLGIVLGSLSSSMVPLSRALPVLAMAKTFREAATRFRECLHGVLIFEFARSRFTDFFAKSRGLEYLSEGSGQLVAGLILAAFGFLGSFQLMGLLLLGSLSIFYIGFDETRQPTLGRERPGLRETYSLSIPGPLKLLAISSLLFSVGLSTSHNFIMPLFFSKKFGATVGQVSLILGLHRLSLALPLFFSGTIMRRSLRKIIILSLIYEGTAISITGLAPGLVASTTIWLTHDILGASLWIPAQAVLIQHYARDQIRGRDVSKVAAIGALGYIFGPVIAGWTSSISISAPFILSGIVVAASGIPLLPLREPSLEEKDALLARAPA